MSISDAIKSKDEAERLLPVLRRQARRAFVIELTGTPKAGKTTSVSVLKRFFEKCGYRVHLLKERAGECPLPMKGHFFFNAWTTCTMVAEVLQTVDTEVDIMILDRGFFDALIWLELQHRRAQLTDTEKRTFADFVRLERWRTLVDVTVVMSVDPEKAIERENENLIIAREGSVMNPSALAEFNSALEAAATAYKDDFKLIQFNSSAGIKQSNTDLVAGLLQHIGEWADPIIFAVPREDVLRSFHGRTFVPMPEASEILDRFRQVAVLRRRSELEADTNLIQLVACGVLRAEDDRYFVLRRSEKDSKSKHYGVHTLWKGCHVETAVAPSISQIEACLERRLLDDLHLATFPKPTPIGLAWVEADAHLGAMFEFRISSPHVLDSLKKKEFRKSGRSEPLGGAFLSGKDLLQRADELSLEPWSKMVLEHSREQS